MSEERKYIKRLFYDIEICPCLGWFFKPSFKMSLDYGNILENAKIICISYKWEHQEKIHHLNWDRDQNDKDMVEKFIPIMQKADEIIGHNVDRFDTKWIRTRAIFHRLPMPPDYISLDTLKQARSGFVFPSNRLDAICQYLGLPAKMDTPKGLWLKVWREKSRKDLALMLKYCDKDVLIVEGLYNIMKNYLKPKSALNADRGVCPSCASSRVIKNNTRISAKGVKVYQLQCKECNKYFTVNAHVFDKIERTGVSQTKLTNAK